MLAIPWFHNCLKILGWEERAPSCPVSRGSYSPPWFSIISRMSKAGRVWVCVCLQNASSRQQHDLQVNSPPPPPCEHTCPLTHRAWTHTGHFSSSIGKHLFFFQSSWHPGFWGQRSSCMSLLEGESTTVWLESNLETCTETLQTWKLFCSVVHQ